MKRIFSLKDKNMEIEEKNKQHLEELEEVFEYQRRIEKKKETVVVEFSPWYLIVILLILALIFCGSQLLTISIFIFLSAIFMSAALPIVRWLVSKKMSKLVATLLTYIVGVIVFSALFSIVFIPFLSQLSELVSSIPQWLENFTQNFKGISIANGLINLDMNSIGNMLSDFFTNVKTVEGIKDLASAVSGFFGGFSLVLTALIFSIYLVLDHDSLLDFILVKISSDQKKERVRRLVLDLEEKLGNWMLGQATVSALAGIFAGIALLLLGIPFALPLGVLVALLVAVPSIGATLSTVILALVALLTTGPLAAVVITLYLILYQQVENNFIVPKVMSNAVGIRPVLVMFGVMIFLIIFGVMGALIAVPIMVIMKILYEFYIDLQKLKAKGIV